MDPDSRADQPRPRRDAPTHHPSQGPRRILAGLGPASAAAAVIAAVLAAGLVFKDDIKQAATLPAAPHGVSGTVLEKPVHAPTPPAPEAPGGQQPSPLQFSENAAPVRGPGGSDGLVPYPSQAAQPAAPPAAKAQRRFQTVPHIYDLNPKPAPSQNVQNQPTETNELRPQKPPPLSDITVKRAQVRILVWDNDYEDYDVVNIYLNGRLAYGNVVLKNARQFHPPPPLKLELDAGVNILTVEAVNIGDPEINRRRNMLPYNTASIKFSGVVKGQAQQGWWLGMGEKATMRIIYTPQTGGVGRL